MEEGEERQERQEKRGKLVKQAAEKVSIDRCPHRKCPLRPVNSYSFGLSSYEPKLKIRR